MSHDLAPAAIQEVYNFHDLIQKWFHDPQEKSSELLGHMLSTFHANFSMINPNGSRLDYKGLGTFLTGIRGTRPDVRIEVTPPKVVLTTADSCVLYYEEYQHMANKRLHRLSTAVFVSDGAGGVKWRHLQETLAALPPTPVG